MVKLTAVQRETREFWKAQIDEARQKTVDIKKVKKRDLASAVRTIDAQNGIVYTRGGRETIRTLKKLEESGLIEILEDNSGIGTGFGACPSKVRVLNY